MKKIIYSIFSVSLVFVLMLSFDNAEAQNSEYKYAKNAYFEYHTDTYKLYWVEECTPESGGQCTTSSGAFRTDLTPIIKEATK